MRPSCSVGGSVPARSASASRSGPSSRSDRAASPSALMRCASRHSSRSIVGGDVVRQPAKGAAPPRRPWRPTRSSRTARASRANPVAAAGMICGTSGATSVASSCSARSSRRWASPAEPAEPAEPAVAGGGTRRRRRSVSARRSRRWVAAGLTTACRTCAGTPYAADTPQHAAREGAPRALGEAQVGFPQQAPQDHRGPGLHVVEHPGRQGTSHPAAEQRGHVDEQPLAGVGVHRRPGTAVGDGRAEQGGHGGRQGGGRTPGPSA